MTLTCPLPLCVSRGPAAGAVYDSDLPSVCRGPAAGAVYDSALTSVCAGGLQQELFMVEFDVVRQGDTLVRKGQNQWG